MVMGAPLLHPRPQTVTHISPSAVVHMLMADFTGFQSVAVRPFPFRWDWAGVLCDALSSSGLRLESSPAVTSWALQSDCCPSLSPAGDPRERGLRGQPVCHDDDCSRDHGNRTKNPHCCAVCIVHWHFLCATCGQINHAQRLIPPWAL